MSGQTVTWQREQAQREADRRAGRLAPNSGITPGDTSALSPEDAAAYDATFGGHLNRDGTEMDRLGRANQLAGQNILDAQGIEAQAAALGIDDYSYNAALDGGAGWNPEDQYAYLGQMDALGRTDQRRTDTMGLDAQRSVLGMYSNALAQGGLDASDRARLEQSRSMRATQARGAEQAIMANAAEQGRMGGNAQLLSKLQAQQNSANQGAMDDLNIQAMALDRRNALMSGMGTVGYQVQSAQDAIDQFNTMGERDRKLQNFNEQNSRDRYNTDTTNHGVDLRYGADTERSSLNTDRTNDASRFNVSPGQGSRGMVSDRAAASSGVQNARLNAMTQLTQHQEGKDAAKGANTQAWISALAGLGGAGVSALTMGATGGARTAGH